MPVTAVGSKDVLHSAQIIEVRGAAEVARRILADIWRVFLFTFHSGYVDRNPAPMLNKVLKQQVKRHFAAIDPEELPALLKALAREACVEPIVRIAMQLMLLVFVRMSELIDTPWSEIDLAKGEWVTPWNRMKRGKRTINPDRNNHHVCQCRSASTALERSYKRISSLLGFGLECSRPRAGTWTPLSNVITGFC